VAAVEGGVRRRAAVGAAGGKGKQCERLTGAMRFDFTVQIFLDVSGWVMGSTFDVGIGRFLHTG
jgi:hypothetical protein